MPGPATWRGVSGIAALSFVAAAVSISLQGYSYGFNNNGFHTAFLLRLYHLPQFVEDPLMQTMPAYVSGLLAVLRTLATETNIATLLMVAHWVGHALILGGILLIASALSRRSRTEWPILGGLLALTPALSGITPVGGHDLLIDAFTHTAYANGAALLAFGLLLRGRVFPSYLAAGGAVIGNAFVGAWTVAALTVAVMADTRRNESRGRRAARAASGIGLATLVALPVIVWILRVLGTVRPHAPFDFRDYVRDYYPGHYLIEAAGASQLFALVTVAGIAVVGALAVSPDRRRPLLLLVGSLLFTFAVGCVAPYVTGRTLILNLHFLRVDGLLTFVAVGVAASLATSLLVDAERRTQGLMLGAGLLSGDLLTVWIALLAVAAVRTGDRSRAYLAAIVVVTIGAAFVPAPVEVWGLGRIAAGLLALACVAEGWRRDDALVMAFAAVLLGAAGAQSPAVRLFGTVPLALVLGGRSLVWAVVAGVPSLAAAAFLAGASSYAAVAACGQIGVATLGLVMQAKPSVRARFRIATVLPAAIIAAACLAVMLDRRDLARRASDFRAPWQDVMTWARTQSEPDDVFLLPRIDILFQGMTRRATWVDWKAGGAVAFAPDYYWTWKSRMDRVAALRTRTDSVRLACAEGIDFLIAEVTDPHADDSLLEARYRSGRLAVLAPTAGACARVSAVR